jgi:hypothetical protein
MAQQTISIGTTANDGTGDTLRDAFDKANDNFTELYASGGGGDLVDDTTPQLGGDLDLNGNQITGSGGTVTTSQPIIDVSQTWNNAAVTFTGIKANITSTASAEASKLLDLQVGGTSKVFVNKEGIVNIINTSHTIQHVNDWLVLKGATGIYFATSAHFGVRADGKVLLGGGVALGWGNTNATGDQILVLINDDNDVLAQRRTTNPQTYRLYNTYTNASNYERLALKWGSNVCTITTEALGTGTLRGLKIGEAVTSLVGFYGVTPVVQQASADQAVVTLGNANSEISDLTFSASPTQGECQALRDKCEELADDVRALSTLVHSLRTALLNTGLIKGAA